MVKTMVKGGDGSYKNEDDVIIEKMAKKDEETDEKEEKSDYDSTEDTTKHIKRVGELLGKVCDKLVVRGEKHDASKLSSAEKKHFDEFTPKLKDCTYGSDEYKEYLKGLQVALDHHYGENDHHPEHHKQGVKGMDLLSLMEMLSDWKAATERHSDGDIMKSLKMNKDRFDMDDQLYAILKNTVDNMKWG